MDPVSGALLGVVFQELYDTIKYRMQPSLTPVASLRSQLDDLANKVQELSRKFTAIDERYPEAGAHRETEKLRELLEKANALVIDCGGLRWWSLRRKRRFSKRLTELSYSFDKLLDLKFGPGLIMARLMTVQEEVVRINSKLDRMYKGQKVGAPPSGWRSGGRFAGGRRGMRAEIRYERTEKKRSLYVSFCWGCCCGGDSDNGDGEEVDVGRRGRSSKWA